MTEPQQPDDQQPQQPDPWLPERLAKFAALVAAEQAIRNAFSSLLTSWVPRLRSRVFAQSEVPDPVAVFAMAPLYARKVDTLVQVEIREALESAYAAVMPDLGPGRDAHIAAYLEGVRNRMLGTPDQVYRLITEQVQQASGEGWSIPELAGKVNDILDESGTVNWANRATVVARTEALGAYNAGTYFGYLDYAAALGGEFEKGWLATHDTRTRPTHKAADLGTPETGQRVPLGEPFEVGGFAGMFPGDPSLPPEEVIQCRCSMVLLRPGEHADLTNRHLRKAA